MTTGVFTHTACRHHDPGPSHPERPERLNAVLAALTTPEFENLTWYEAPEAPREAIARIHPGAYTDRILSSIPAAGFQPLDLNTTLSPGSGDAALRAAGAGIAAVEAVLAGEISNAFCAVRPPGHHAEPDQPMGFCLFNTIAIAAAHARAAHGVQRIAIVDFDVHHGNGTQAAFWDDPDTLFICSHESPLYPGTGSQEERGAHGTILNIPFPGTIGPEGFRRLYEAGVIPALETFAPDFLFISAGFDGHAADPLSSLTLTEEDYGWLTERLRAFAEKACGARVVSTLEGGYDLPALSRSVAAHVRALMSGYSKDGPSKGGH